MSELDELARLRAENSRLRARLAEAEATESYVTRDEDTGAILYAGDSHGEALAAARAARNAALTRASDGLLLWSTRRNGGRRCPRR